MKLHIKTLLLATFFAFAALGLQAQEKYQHCILYTSTAYMGATVNTGKETKAINFTKEELKDLGLLNLLLRETMKLEDEGWELFNTQIYNSGTAINYQYHFRKKK